MVSSSTSEELSKSSPSMDWSPHSACPAFQLGESIMVLSGVSQGGVRGEEGGSVKSALNDGVYVSDNEDLVGVTLL